MSSYKYAVTVSREGDAIVLSPNMFSGSENEYRPKDMLSYLILDKPVCLDESASWAGDNPFDADQLKSLKFPPKWMLSSPNTRRLDEPALGDRFLQCYDNRMYGLDDRGQHPQILTKGFEFACCNPRPSAELDDLFWTPTEEDTELVVGTAILTDVRVLKLHGAIRLERQLDSATRLAFDVLTRYPHATLLSSLTSYARQCLERLTEFGLSFAGILRTVGDFRRALVDCRGLAAWVDIYYPRTRPSRAEDVDKKWPVDSSLMGCFTHDPKIVQMLHRIGVPVTWIRPDFSVNLSDTRIFIGGRQVSLAPPPHVSLTRYLPFGAKETPFPIIATGPPGTELQKAMLKLSSSIVDHTVASKIALNKMEAKRAVVAPPAAQEVVLYSLPSMLDRNSANFISLTPSSLSSIPGLTNTSQPPALTQAAVDPLPNAFESRPPEIEMWCNALQHAQKRGNVRSKLYFGYVFPDPSIITNAQTEESMAKYALGWAASRAVHVAKYTEGTRLGIINRDDWRKFLRSILTVLDIDIGEGTKSFNASRESSSIGLSSTAGPGPSASSASSGPSTVRTTGASRRERKMRPQVPSLILDARPESFPALSRHRDMSSTTPSSSSTHTTDYGYVNSTRLQFGLPEVETDSVQRPPTSPLGIASTISALPSPTTGSKRRLEDAQDSGSATKTSRTEEEERKYLECLRDEARNVERICVFEKTITLGKAKDVTTLLAPGVVAELVWELREMSFRIELLLLDQHLAPQYWPDTTTDNAIHNRANETTRLAREVQIRRLFTEAGEDVASLLPMKIPNRDRGLAVYTWSERMKVLIPLREIMILWEGVPQSLKEVEIVNTEEGCASLEMEVTHAYCTMFKSTFGRAPIIPCRLPFKSRTRPQPMRSFGSLGVDNV